MVQLYTRRFQNNLPHKWQALYTRHVMTVNDRKYHRRSSSSSALICRTELLYNINTKRAASKLPHQYVRKTESKSKVNEKRVETPNGMTASILKWLKAFRTILDWIRGRTTEKNSFGLNSYTFFEYIFFISNFWIKNLSDKI